MSNGKGMEWIEDFRQAPEYRLGVAQLRQWHERCRCERLGIKFKPRVLSLRAHKDLSKF